jgi:hypothetical protein
MFRINLSRLQYKIFLWFSLIISLMILFYLSPNLMKPENIVVDDFSQFWAAGRINITGGNPYNPEEIRHTIQDIGGKVSIEDVVSIMLNPPWTLSLIMPFALLDYPVSRMIWLLLNVAVVIISIKLLWDIYEGQEKTVKFALFLIFLFSPTLAAIQKGQFTPIILLGIVLALDHINKKKSLWIAGIFLALASFKPQLVYLLWIVLILWTIVTKKWYMAISTVFTIMLFTILPIMINPEVLTQYIKSMSEYPISEWATPTLGSLLRIIFGLEKFWLQFLPMVLGTIIFTRYWWKHKGTWDWVNGSPLIVATSLLTTPYAWTYDAILFIIPIVNVWILAINYGTQMKNLIIFSSLIIISGLNLFLHTRLNDFWFIWLFPSLFIWYLYSTKHHQICLEH